MASGTVTITSTTGPGLTVTSMVLTNVSDIRFDLSKNMIYVVSNGIIKEFAYNAVATVTFTISGVTATIAVS